jgi:deoxyhypusine synthase
MASGLLINPGPIEGDLAVTEVIDSFFMAFNAGRLREACQLMVQKLLQPDVTVVLTLSGALTPAGLGHAAIVPLIRAGFVDWIVSTGANLYHDIHRSLGFELYAIPPIYDDLELRDEGIIRIYDIVFDQDVLLQTDAFLYRCLEQPEFQRRMSSAELHYRLGRYTLERERLLSGEFRSILSAAYEAGVPVYTSSPGDSTIGMNVAALQATGLEVGFNPEADVIETTAIVHAAKSGDGRSGVVVFGGGSPKNFALQTEPQLQEILGMEEKGHDYFIQFTDARPDTGGLSGATPSEAMTWGKIDPDQLPDAVVCYIDSTVALPLFVSYALAKHPPRPLKRLYDRRQEMVDDLLAAYREKWPDVQARWEAVTDG